MKGEKRGLLYHWCGAYVDSLRRHLVVVASRGRTCLAHLDKPQGSSMTGSFALPFLHVQDDIGEVDHGILYRLVQDMRLKSRDTNLLREPCSILQDLSVLEYLLRLDHQKEGCQRVHYSHRLLAQMLEGEASALSDKVGELHRTVDNLFRLLHRIRFCKPLNSQREHVDKRELTIRLILAHVHPPRSDTIPHILSGLVNSKVLNPEVTLQRR